MKATAKVMIAGVGAETRGDDGIGPAVIRHLETKPLPQGVVCFAVSDPLILIPLMGEAQTLIVIDAVVDEPPGMCRPLDLVELRSIPRRMSTHAIDLPTALTMGSELAARPAELRILGITIRPSFDLDFHLSPAVSAAIPTATRWVRKWAIWALERPSDANR